MKLFFPGSFDPFTIGHADLVERALNLGCEVVIAVGINEAKKPLLSTEQRMEAIRNYYKGYSRVSVIESVPSQTMTRSATWLISTAP